MTAIVEMSMILHRSWIFPSVPDADKPVDSSLLCRKYPLTGTSDENLPEGVSVEEGYAQRYAHREREYVRLNCARRPSNTVFPWCFVSAPLPSSLTSQRREIAAATLLPDARGGVLLPFATYDRRIHPDFSGLRQICPYLRMTS